MTVTGIRVPAAQISPPQMPGSLVRKSCQEVISSFYAASSAWRVACAFGLVRFRLEFGRQLGAFAEEVFFHLFEQEFLGFGLAEIEAVLVHDHFHVLHPALPRFFRNVLVDALAERVPVEGHFVEAGGFFLQLHAKNGAAGGGWSGRICHGTSLARGSYLPLRTANSRLDSFWRHL